MKTKIIFLIVFTVLFATGLIFLFKAPGRYQRIKNERVLLEKRKRAWLNLEKTLRNRIKAFKGTVSIEIKDLDTNWEIAFNKNVLVPSASLVKIPIMLSCFYAAKEGRISLKDTIILKSSDKVSGSKVLGREPAGSGFTIEELFAPMITQSDNAAANALIDFLGFNALNSYFKKMGLKNTNIARKMMDFAERREGEENYTTAEDMAYLLEKVYHNNFLNKEVSEKCLQLLGEQKINDRIPRKLPKEGIFIAHKTGLERHICHDVGIVFTGKGNFLICVLVKHENKLAKSSKRLISNIASLTYNYYQNDKF